MPVYSEEVKRALEVLKREGIKTEGMAFNRVIKLKKEEVRRIEGHLATYGRCIVTYKHKTKKAMVHTMKGYAGRQKASMKGGLALAAKKKAFIVAVDASKK